MAFFCNGCLKPFAEGQALCHEHMTFCSDLCLESWRTRQSRIEISGAILTENEECPICCVVNVAVVVYITNARNARHNAGCLSCLSATKSQTPSDILRDRYPTIACPVCRDTIFLTEVKNIFDARGGGFQMVQTPGRGNPVLFRSAETRPDPMLQSHSNTHACEECNTIFTMFLKRHHCSSCGRSYCDRCAPIRRELQCTVCHPCYIVI